MIDFVKILFVNIEIKRLLNNPVLDFKTDVSTSTGELSTTLTAVYHFCKFTVNKSGSVLFTGSIHKLFNSLMGTKAPNYKLQKTYKGFNGNQFTINDIFEVRAHICQLVKCSPCEMIFQNIEFAINTHPQFMAQLFINGLLYHNGKLFDYAHNRKYAEVKHSRYRVKIYNKGQQYGMSKEVLRIEIAHKKSIDFAETGIKTFEDITENTLNKAMNSLLKRFDEVVYYDYTIDKKTLNKRQKQLLKSYSNQRFWAHEVNPNHRDRPKKKLKELISKHSDNLHLKIKQEIIKKCVIINRLTEGEKCVTINTSNIGLNDTQYTSKKCPITGLSLEHEKKSAKYITTKTIYLLKKNDIQNYLLLCSLFISNKGIRPKFERSIESHLAKQIRNRYFNQNTIKFSGYRQKQYKNQLSLDIFTHV